jgi:membrane protease YdiL (CAAX protease family)
MARDLSLDALATAAFFASLALAIGALARRGRTLADSLALRPGRCSAAEVLALVAGTLGVSHALDAAVDLLGLAETGSLAELAHALAGARGGALGLALLGIGLAPAFAEELLFRGLLLLRIAPVVGGGLAIVLSSLVFGLCHGEPVHAAAAGLLGVYLGGVAWIDRSVRGSIACHAANNLAAVLAAACLPDVTVPSGPTLVVGGAMGATLLAWTWARVNARHPSRHAGFPPPAAGDPRALQSSPRSSDSP